MTTRGHIECRNIRKVYRAATGQSALAVDGLTLSIEPNEFMMPTVPQGIPWHSDFDWQLVNYAPLTVGGVILLTGIWWVLSARKWFKGPVSCVLFGNVSSVPGTLRVKPNG